MRRSSQKAERARNQAACAGRRIADPEHAIAPDDSRTQHHLEQRESRNPRTRAEISPTTKAFQVSHLPIKLDFRATPCGSCLLVHHDRRRDILQRGP